MSTQPTIDDVRAAAQTITAVRNSEDGRQPWDQTGVHAQLQQLNSEGASFQTAVAAGLAAAVDPAAQTPRSMTWAKYRPRTGTAAGQPEPSHGPKCGTCNRPRHVHDEAEAKLPEPLRHPFEISSPAAARRPGTQEQP